MQLVREMHASDGTVKALFHTHDGRAVEAVLMRYRDGRRSICVSSQSGCPLTCTFCATGTMKFGRNLTASEILDQVLHFRRIEPVDHLVFMGMGEPMMNLDHVLAASRKLPDVGITHRRTGISTVGWVPGIQRLTETDMPIRLALSLHAPEDALRSQIMPVNERYPLSEVLAACDAHYERKRRQIFIEYVMLAGVNDGYAQAVQLAQLLDPKVYKLNLIPYNPTDSVYDGSSPRRDRRLPRRARGTRVARNGPADPRPRHRRGLRAARGARMSVAAWLALIVAIIGLFAFDLFFAHRGDDDISLRRAAGWSVLVDGRRRRVRAGRPGRCSAATEAGSYWAGFLMEKALSLDNVFVIAVLLGTFAVPQALKADVLTFGIAVALMLRTVFIVAGVTLLEFFHPAIYVMGALLIFTGIRLAIKSDGADDFAEGRTMRALRRVLPVGQRVPRPPDRRPRGRCPGRHPAAGRAARGRARRRHLRHRLDPRRPGDHHRHVHRLRRQRVRPARPARPLLPARRHGAEVRVPALRAGRAAGLRRREDAGRGPRRPPAGRRLAGRDRRRAGGVGRRLAAALGLEVGERRLTPVRRERAPSAANAQRRPARASPARSRRSRSAAASSGEGSHCAIRAARRASPARTA